jgi:hypothetical protein
VHKISDNQLQGTFDSVASWQRFHPIAVCPDLSLFLITAFRCEVAETCALLGHYAT